MDEQCPFQPGMILQEGQLIIMTWQRPDLQTACNAADVLKKTRTGSIFQCIASGVTHVPAHVFQIGNDISQDTMGF